MHGAFILDFKSAMYLSRSQMSEL